MSSRYFLGPLASLTLLVLLVFAGLQFLHISAGTLVDWVMGIAIAWWLVGVVVIPWNTHFAAKEVLEEALLSQQKGIVIKEESLQYAQKLAKRFYWIAIGLHLGTALGLYLLAYYQITVLGYTAAVAALALTFLRPLQRGYEHLSYKLRNLSEQIRYPRQDVAELRDRVGELEALVKQLQTFLNVAEKDSWAYQQEQTATDLQAELTRTQAQLEEFSQQNRKEHEMLVRQSASEIAKLSEDAQFLNQVRELIRFVKSA
jgi:prefoldin subunit 5